jgi:hypothetical protein
MLSQTIILFKLGTQSKKSMVMKKSIILSILLNFSFSLFSMDDKDVPLKHPEEDISEEAIIEGGEKYNIDGFEISCFSNPPKKNPAGITIFNINKDEIPSNFSTVQSKSKDQIEGLLKKLKKRFYQKNKIDSKKLKSKTKFCIQCNCGKKYYDFDRNKLERNTEKCPHCGNEESKIITEPSLDFLLISHCSRCENRIYSRRECTTNTITRHILTYHFSSKKNIREIPLSTYGIRCSLNLISHAIEIEK